MEFMTTPEVYLRGKVITDMKLRGTNLRKTEHLAITPLQHYLHRHGQPSGEHTVCGK